MKEAFTFRTYYSSIFKTLTQNLFFGIVEKKLKYFKFGSCWPSFGAFFKTFWV